VVKLKTANLVGEVLLIGFVECIRPGHLIPVTPGLI
jgi:hypothetical protein